MNILCHTKKEIRTALTAARMRSNDQSVSVAIGCLLYLNSNRDPEKTETITDYSQFLPFPAEYQLQLAGNTESGLNVSPGTARMILATYGMFNSRSIGVISTSIDEIRRIANQ